MMKRYADVLLGTSSRGVRMALDSLPRAHELSLVVRNVTELSALSGHSLRHSLRMDAIRKRYRKQIRRVRAKIGRLDKKLMSEKQRIIELATASIQLKADVEKITNERQMVEEENKKLRAELEREKAKGKRSRERLVLLHDDIYDKTLKNETLHDALNETSQKLIKDRRISKTNCLEGELERIRATMISYAILEDTSTSSSDKQVEDPSPIIVEDPMSAIIVYEHPPTFEEEDRESVGEFEMSSSEDVDSLFND
ncbi:hypothetical protein Dimus_008337 [Dionaea muscipula]